MRNRLKATGIVTLLLLLFACTPVYRVQVNGYADPDSTGRIRPAARICVLENEKAENPLLDKEIKAKIQAVLQHRGLVLSSRDAADLFCRFNYGLGTGLTQIGSVPVQSPPVTTSVVVSNQGGAVQTTAILTPGPTSYIPYARTFYDRWLHIAILDGESLRKGKADKVLWYGDIVSSGESRDLRTVVNYMLVEAFEIFGRDTRKGILKEIREDDVRLKVFTKE